VRSELEGAQRGLDVRRPKELRIGRPGGISPTGAPIIITAVSPLLFSESRYLLTLTQRIGLSVVSTTDYNIHQNVGDRRQFTK